MSMAENMIKKALGNLDESMECLVKEMGRIEQEEKEKNQSMEKLEHDLSLHKKILDQSKSALEKAEKTLESENETLKKEETNVNSCQKLSIAGGTLLAIPFFFTQIAGLTMLCVGLRGRHNAKDVISTAKEEITKAESHVKKYNSKVSDYQSRISEAQKEIDETRTYLKNIQKEIDELKENTVEVAKIQTMVREAVRLLSNLSGKVTVLQKQTQCSILWKPVVNVMKEVMIAASNIAENQLIFSQGLPGLMNTLRENSGRLLAIRNSPENCE
ncbi:uncharacterized protein LOC130433362 [Triplophysa dalaica]|uniref:uncharacterized protein LOC130433362 n=1 Tax=Triplophysa dalaica TaxID=1582913 RepID=UPI0024DF368E|nr:uncharacterized protein LOC130433362 [Triplophysa dalaica]